jgi:hypothetical protein
MKPDPRWRRIPKCMIRRVVYALMFLLLGAAAALAQGSIVASGGSRYEGPLTTKTFDFKGYTNLSFTSSSYLSGKLTIVSSDKAQTTVSFRKVLKSESLDQANDFADYIDVNFEQLENEFAVSAETKSQPPWSGTDWAGTVEIEIDVPRNENLKIDVRTTVFTIDVTGPFASVDISNSLGEVAVEKITSKVRISSDNGGISVRDCTGPVTVSTSLRPITLTRVDGKLGSIKLRNSNSKIVLESVRGEIDARSENAPITGNDVRFEAGHSVLSTENSGVDIDAEAVNGDLTIRSANGKISLSLPANTSASYVLQVEEVGRIYTRSLPMTVETASRSRVIGYSGTRRSKIEIDMTGVGTIDLEGKPANRTSLH